MIVQVWSYTVDNLSCAILMLTLGTTLRRLRERAGLTQEELASTVGITGSHLSHIESGRREPSLKVLRQMAQSLSVWPGLLLAAVMQTEMPEGLHPVFERFVDSLLEATDATQLSLPLSVSEKDEIDIEIAMS